MDVRRVKIPLVLSSLATGNENRQTQGDIFQKDFSNWDLNPQQGHSITVHQGTSRLLTTVQTVHWDLSLSMVTVVTEAVMFASTAEYDQVCLMLDKEGWTRLSHG